MSTDYLTRKEAAAYLRIGLTKLTELTNLRRIAFYRLGGSYRYTRADLDAYVATCRVDTPTPMWTATYRKRRGA